MRCLSCRASDTGVIETRPARDGTRRRRRCEGCGTRFTTIEMIATAHGPRVLGVTMRPGTPRRTIVVGPTGLSAMMSNERAELLRVLLDRWPSAISRDDVARCIWGRVAAESEPEAVRHRVEQMKSALGPALTRLGLAISVVKGLGFSLCLLPRRAR